jgi:ABC-type transporter Mla subunit MlaD
VERDAKYMAVGLFALLAVAAAVAFVWWYSGASDRRSYERYEIHFSGTVSGLSQGSPVRYLGVDVGRVRSLSVDSRKPGQVTVVAEIDSSAPISGATRAKLGLLGLTGLLYIDLQLDSAGDPARTAAGRGSLPDDSRAEGRHRGIPRASAGRRHARGERDDADRDGAVGQESRLTERHAR